MKKGQKISEQRRQLLEKWLQSILTYRDCKEALLTFLGVSEIIVKTVMSSSGCRLAPSEVIVAAFIRDLTQKGEKNRSRYLKNFDKEFFDSCESSLSPGVQNALLNVLVPLCGASSSACHAIDILYRMLRIESYRFAGEIQQTLFKNTELLKLMQVEKHILNNYNQETGQQGYFIAKLIKDHFDRNGMQQYFKYVLNSNDEAVEQFGVKIEGKSVRATVCRGISGIGKVGEWTWLNTENYPGGLKVCFRRMEPLIEVKAEIFMEASLDLIASHLVIPEKRKSWDLFLKGIKLVKKIDDHTHLVLYTLTKDKQKNSFELALETRKTESLGKMLLTFRSHLDNGLFPEPAYQRVECAECYYEVLNVDVKVRRSSSSTDDYESEGDSLESLKSCRSVSLFQQKAISKVVLFLKMKREMARLFVTDLSEETSVLKDSLVSLKKKVEKYNF